MTSYEGSIASVTPTVCGLFGVAVPATSSHPPLSSVGALAKRMGVSTVERGLIYCPDALGDHLWARFPEQRDAITRQCPHRVSLCSVVPPKTPVCFASVFTGATPDIHGIRRYEKPVLTCDTLFDVLIRAGRKVAIVAVHDSSIDLLFRNRTMDYFSEPYDQEVTARAMSLLSQDEHDLVVIYHQEYDDQVHETEPFSDSCVAAMNRHVQSIGKICEAAHVAWRHRAWAAVIAPDHGAHVNPETQRGDHGLDIPDDMAVSHWYGVHKAGSV
jgi:hypothetical protein